MRHGEQLDAQAVPEPLDMPELRWALRDLFMISQTDPDREIYEARLKKRRDLSAEGQAMREEGRAETLRIAIHALQKSLGRDVTPPHELQPLSLEELEGVWARLSNNET
ncbi:MAG TPA: hypothetical protein VFW87_13235 [Pirellulales bacterium]|nr:hypothetical protein [Pirellulales bacterium]